MHYYLNITHEAFLFFFHSIILFILFLGSNSPNSSAGQNSIYFHFHFPASFLHSLRFVWTLCVCASSTAYFAHFVEIIKNFKKHIKKKKKIT